LYYLNPAAYKPVQHVLDPHYSLNNDDDLSVVGLGILDATLTTFFDASGSLLREACVKRVERLVKLENRSKQRGKPMDKDNAKLVNGIKLWLTTVTRIVLFPLENATDSDQLARAATRTWTFLLTTPLLARHVSTLVLDHLRKWTLGAIHPLVMKSGNKDTTMDDSLVGGNGYLFLMANLVDLYQEKFMNHQEEREMALHLMTSVMHLISLATPYYSDRQRHPFSHYHPIFKWSCCPWGDQIDAPVYEAVIQDQLATLWSRHFMDQLLEPILKFAHSSPLNLANKVTTTRRLLAGKKKTTMDDASSSSSNSNTLPINTKKDMAEFSMNTQLVFSMYSQLGNLFTVQRKIILARIAFTPGLMSQLWRVMNHFGPQGNMVIYLDAARKHAAAIGNKEPLIDVLKMFCEACSLVFL
jgi:ubiquitin-protein ligase E3 B